MVRSIEAQPSPGPRHMSTLFFAFSFPFFHTVCPRSRGMPRLSSVHAMAEGGDGRTDSAGCYGTQSRQMAVLFGKGTGLSLTLSVQQDRSTRWGARRVSICADVDLVSEYSERLYL